MHNKKILIIEDESALSEALLIIFEINGFEPLLASTGAAGLQLLYKNNIDLIICDVGLPDVSGFDILRRVREDDEICTLPFIFLSALADKDDIKTGMQLGADDYITKPFTSKNLVNIIERHLNISC